jgi:hypothetical protein
MIGRVHPIAPMIAASILPPVGLLVVLVGLFYYLQAFECA